MVAGVRCCTLFLVRMGTLWARSLSNRKYPSAAPTRSKHFQRLPLVAHPFRDRCAFLKHQRLPHSGTMGIPAPRAAKAR
jgi:hypothetical protein